MKIKFAFASALIAFGSLVGLANTASAGTDVDVDINIGLPRPPTIVIGGRDHDDHRHYSRRDRDDHRRHDRRGYWKEVVVKVWVPGRTVVSCDRWGREIRHRERGYYTYRTDRVWVSRDHRG